MQQVLFNIPLFKSAFPPDGVPVYGFGAMLFVTFILVTWWGTARAKPIGMPAPRFQDFVIVVFVSGIIGARILYMIQYTSQFPDESILGILGAFFKIWEGGIVFYGSAFGGAIGYGLFYWFVMRKLDISGWRLADAVAPLLAMGLAIGRIGCYLNGCCWGQVACEEICPVPLGAAHFPLLPAHARDQLVADEYLQTSTGFAIQPRARATPYEDPRALVTAVEPGSPAAKAGVQIGDRVVRVNGETNSIIVDVSGSEEKVRAATDVLLTAGGRRVDGPTGRTRIAFNDLPPYLKARAEATEAVPGIDLYATDRLEDLTRDWPRGKAPLTLSVERNGNYPELQTFSPRTIGLYPTQLYETVSMVLLILLLLAFYPFRRHDGQLFVLLMIGYAVHRFINESLRIEPSYSLGLTLSQWGSVIVFSLAVAMEIYLWCAMPSRWKGDVPLQPQHQPQPESKA